MTQFLPRDLKEGLNGHLNFLLTGWEEGYAEIRVNLTDMHRNRQGGVHGGTMTALIDAATGFCGVYEPDPDQRRGNVTVSLTTNFVGRPKGETLICEAKIVKAGRKIYFSSAEVKDELNNLIATANAVYAYTDINAQRR